MAYTNDDWYRLQSAIRQARNDMRYYDEYSEPWTKARLDLEKFKEEKKENHIIPKVGDLITDEEYPDDGIAVVLEVRDRRKHFDVYRVAAPRGSIWLNKDYIEYQCRLLS